MPDTPTPAASGADLARQALAAARAAAKTQPAPGTKKTRRSIRPARGERTDPQAFGAVLERLTTDQGWSSGITGGSLLDQWTAIAPTELATTVQPTAYDPDRGLLTLQPSTAAYGTQLRLFQHQLVKHLNQAIGRPAVRAIRVLPPGHIPSSAQPSTGTVGEQPAAADEPVKTRATASPGYRACLEAALAHKPHRQPTNPYVLEARERQERALRASRLPESEHRDAMWAQADTAARPAPGSMEASEQAALAYKHREQAGGAPVPRAFDAA